MLGETEVGVIKVLVDDTNHTLLAVVPCSLGAVVPDSVLGLDNNLEDKLVLALLGRKPEAGEEAGAVGERFAGVGKVGLGDRVVGGEELPLDNVTNLSDDVVGLEVEAVEAGDDGVGDASEVNGAGGLVTRRGGWGGKGSGSHKGSGDDLCEHI